MNAPFAFKRTPSAPWRIGVDIGGTFTDLLLMDDDGELFPFKSPSDPKDPTAGVMKALKLVAGGFSLDVEDVLRDCNLFIHGSTIATNTLLEHKGANVVLLTTEGFRDSIEIRRGIRKDPWDHRSPYPEVLVRRRNRLPVRERIDRGGRKVIPLDRDALDETLAKAKAAGAEAVAICLMNSFIDDEHEIEVKKAAEAALPDALVYSSSEIAPIMGEFERASTAAVCAYIAPRTIPYLRRLDTLLRDLGYKHRLLLVQSNGGAISVEQLQPRPVTLVLSGPAAGASSLQHYSAIANSKNLIAMEIGGTSCDVIVMADGEISSTDDLWVDDYRVAIPSVEIHTVGAGGGTIANVDDGNLLRVGPRGAGARPGPACYGYGGESPTVTDAQLALGRLKSGPYAGGAVNLQLDLATHAIKEKIAKPLKITTEAAAIGIIRLVEQHLCHAVERNSVERGFDPRRFTLVAAGGAGGMHGAAVARLLGCGSVFVPRLAGVYCSLGMLNSDVRHDYVKSWLNAADLVSASDVEALFQDLERQARATLEEDGFADEHIQFRREVAMRYRGQQWPVQFPIDRWDLDTVKNNFAIAYQRLFGHVQPNGTIQLVDVRVTGVGRLPSIVESAVNRPNASAAATEEREIWIDPDVGRAMVPVFYGPDLPPGFTKVGPCLVEELTTTILVGAGDRMRVDEFGHYHISIRQNGDAA